MIEASLTIKLPVVRDVTLRVEIDGLDDVPALRDSVLAQTEAALNEARIDITGKRRPRKPRDYAAETAEFVKLPEGAGPVVDAGGRSVDAPAMGDNCAGEISLSRYLSLKYEEINAGTMEVRVSKEGDPKIYTLDKVDSAKERPYHIKTFGWVDAQALEAHWTDGTD